MDFNENNEQTDDYVQADEFLSLPPMYEDIKRITVIGPDDDDAYDEVNSVFCCKLSPSLLL